MVGNRVSTYAATVKREYDEGHQLANHTWDHAKLTGLSYASVISELNKTDSAVTAVIGQDLDLVLRPPYGSYNSNIKSWAGRPLILWSVDTNDWKYRNATTVKNNIVNNAKDGAIVLLHDLYPTSVQGAIAAIDELQQQGYTFVTVNELFRRKGLTLNDGAVYTNAPNNGIDLGPIDPYYYDETKLSEHWAYQYIVYVKENGLMNGMSPDLFGPNYPMTRAMFVAVLNRLTGENTTGYTNPYSDVSDGAWYESVVAWAAAKQIVSGIGDSRFAPEDSVTREQAAVMMARLMQYLHLDTAAVTALTFSDSASISPWAQDDVALMAAKGILTGKDNNLLDPQAKTTRAEAAAILTRFSRLMQSTPATMTMTFSVK